MCIIIVIISFGFALQHWIAENYLTSFFGFAIGFFLLLMLINNIRTMKARKQGECDKSCELLEWLKYLIKR